MQIVIVVVHALFLSTLSLRRATTLIWDVIAVMTISIHALLAESDSGYGQYYIHARISIHALLAESDSVWVSSDGSARLFLSTLSLRRATAGAISLIILCPISIHALLAESDRVLEVTRNAHTDFYPRSPCGERRQLRALLDQLFQISIHALLAESDSHGYQS